MQTRILRSWRELEELNVSLEKRAAKIANVDADQRFLAVLLTRLEALRRSV